MTPRIFLTLLVIYQARLISSYSSGAPDRACAALHPSGPHGTSTANGPAPFTLTFSKNTYSPGDIIQVTLSGVNGTSFIGFLLAARRINGQTDNIGNFTAETGSHTVCNQPLGNGVTHSDSGAKSFVSFNWTAPSTSQGDLIFHYTVVRAKAVDYFENLTSTILKAADETTFTKNVECGSRRGCYSNCLNNECDWEMSWKNAGDVYEITIKAFVTNNTYVALGFSNTSAMSPASVLSCAVMNHQVTVAVSYNAGHGNRLLTNLSGEISNVTTSYINGLLQCSFLRDTISTNPEIFNLTDPWFLNAAKGPLHDDGALGRHDRVNRFATSTRIDLANNTSDYIFPTAVTTSSATSGSTTTTTSMTSSSPGGAIPKDPECGKTKGCFVDKCDNNNLCNLLLTWQDQGSNIEFSLNSVLPRTGDHYVAMGFSDSGKMAPASVLGCSTKGVYASYNDGYNNKKLTNPTEGLSDSTYNFVDGVLSCTVLRETMSNNDKIYDLNQTWYLIVAVGPASSDGSLQEHSQTYKTDTRINFTDTGNVLAARDDYPLVKAHGCLMAIAWMFLASIGLAMARFFKKQWPDSKLGGVKIWFAIHRMAMVAAFVIGMTAFALIFIQVKDYSTIAGEGYKKAHPILGIIVTALLFINPFMSLLRCAPDHPRRVLFNWAHWFVGTSAHILGGLTIAFGLYLPKASLDADKGLIIMLIYGGWHVAFFLVMSLIEYLSNSKPSKTVATPMEMTDAPPEPIGNSSYMNVSGVEGLSQAKYGILQESNEPRYSGVKKLLMFAHCVVLVGLTVALIYLIVNGDM